MSKVKQRRPRKRLTPEDYSNLRKGVLQRDGWRCQNCGTSENLHVHHIERRSNLGNDGEENLITVCAGCHSAIHGSRSTG